MLDTMAKKTLGRILIIFIKFYRIIISPLFPPSCRFYPTCSVYAIAAIERYGPFKGMLYGALRLLRCHPFHPGGYDPVK